MTSRSSSCEEESESSSTVSTSHEPATASTYVEDGLFLSHLLNMHSEGLEACDMMTDFDAVFGHASSCPSRHGEDFISEEELLSLLV